MTKLNFISIIAGGLLVSNLLLVGFVILRPNTPERHPEPREIIIQKLDFDEEQVAAYEELIHEHRTQIRETDQQIRKLKNRLYSSLAAPTPPAEKDSLIRELGRMQMQIEEINYRHFSEIRSLCRPDQLGRFETLSREIAGLFARHPRKKPHR
jgi:protein CpxP